MNCQCHIDIALKDLPKNSRIFFYHCRYHNPDLVAQDIIDL